MSQTETHFGKLRKIELGGLTIEEKCEEICKNQYGKTELASYNRDWKEQLYDIANLPLNSRVMFGLN